MGNDKKYCPNCRTEYFSPGNHKCPVCGTPLISNWDSIQLSDAQLEINIRKGQENSKTIPIVVKK